MARQAGATIEAYVADWNSHDVDEILGYFVEDCVYEDAALGVVNRERVGHAATESV
jgi:ketosteroid isomerase-like protein